MFIKRRLYFLDRKMCLLFVFFTLFLIIIGCTTCLNESLPSFYILVNLSSLHQNIMFTNDKVYFLNAVAIDFYSIDELSNGSRLGLQWKTFPLPNEHLPANVTPWIPSHDYLRNDTKSINISTPSATTTGLAFVDRIYIVTNARLTDRHANLKKILAQYQIHNYEWRMKWTYAACRAPNNTEEVHRKLNLETKSSIGDPMQQRRCPISMEHVDIWHDIVNRNSSLSLILEDDAVFVPFFREKFDRTIYTAIRTGALKMGGLAQCTKKKIYLPMNSSEWFEQDPMIVIGSSFQLYDHAFTKNRTDAQPMLSTHKKKSSRGSHAYLLTACTAQALINEIAARKYKLLGSDFMLNVLVAASPTIQSFWLDPPIAYQGNYIEDLDGIPSFARTSY